MKQILLFAAFCVAVACNQAPKDKTGNVLLENDKDMIVYGQNLFGKYCQKCHGEAGESMLPNVPNLTKTTLADAEEIGNVIFHGRGNMPAFEEQIGEPEIRAISLYVVSIKK
jgi:mono/diheme cytochrome c family protein